MISKKRKKKVRALVLAGADISTRSKTGFTVLTRSRNMAILHHGMVVVIAVMTAIVTGMNFAVDASNLPSFPAATQFTLCGRPSHSNF
jgi:hypothetical protein